ncbi:MAG: molybdopterin-guanine dinucleotide biosynthesis protein B [Methylococcales bacterium]|nr:MAG: molybdopterin-guanine dinucleotide biosynthesis protein B [Methylococcales bacterium]
MQHAHVPLLGFVAASGTGKTTLLEHIIPILKQQGVRVGLIKHSHHNFQIDQPGKDSFRLRTAGASPVMLVSTHRRAIITEIVPTQEPRLDEELKLFDQSQVDLVLVEGFKAEPFPKVELHRPSLKQPLLYPTDPDIIAIASDELLELPEHLPNLDINQPQMIVDFIIKEFMEKL